MPIWKIACECGEDSSTLLTYKKREEVYGGKVPCRRCGELNSPRPAIKAVAGCSEIKVSQVGRTFSSAAELDRYCEANDCEAVSKSSKRWTSFKDRAKEAHQAQVREEGYRDIADKRNKWKGQKEDRVRAQQQKKIDSYHAKHGSEDKQTVEKAYGSVE